MKIVDFLIGEYLRQKKENLGLKRKEIAQCAVAEGDNAIPP